MNRELIQQAIDALMECDRDGDYPLIEQLNAALAAPVAPAEAVVYPPDGTVSPFAVINLGAGAVRMGDAIHDGRLPALWFGRDGEGMGHEVQMDREAREGETLAAVTFANVEGLDVLLDVLHRCRRRFFPTAAPVAPAEPAEGWVLVPKRMTQEMRDVTDSEGWTWEDLLAEAGSISQEEYAAIAAAPVAPAGDKPATSEPVHQWRETRRHQWWDGHPDHDDGHGPYETRTLYTAPPDVPPGWMLVPVEPTAEMVSAACAASGDSIGGRPVWKLSEDAQAAHAYRAMLAAAPKAPT